MIFKQIRFNKRQNRMYLDIDWRAQQVGNFLVIDCYRILDPNDFTNVSKNPHIFNDIDKYIIPSSSSLLSLRSIFLRNPYSVYLLF